MVILVVDPGDTSGIVLYDTELECILTKLAGNREQTYRFIGMNKKWDVAVHEEFMLYPWMAKQQSFSKFDAVKVIGAIELLALFRNKTVISQPASARNMVTPAIAARFGLTLEGSSTHVVDAIKHLVVYLVKEANKCRNT